MTTVGDFNPGPAVTSTANLVAGLSSTSVPVPVPLDVVAANYAAARLLSGVNTGDRLQILGRTSQSDGGQGLFTWVAGGSTSINDGIELSATGGIWRRAGIFLLDPAMLGLTSFTFATLPTPTQMTNMPAGIRAYTTDAGVVSWTGTLWLYLATGTPTVVNLRQLGVTASTSAAFNTQAILAAFNQAGPQGTVVVPNFGTNQPVTHLGFSPPNIAGTGFTLTGENVRSFDTALSGSGAALFCTDITATGIGLSQGGQGITISNLTIQGGYFGLKTGTPSTVTQGFAYNNLRFIGPYGRSGLAFAGHNEHGRVENLEFQTIGFPGYDKIDYAIELINEATAALVDTVFDFVWVYGQCKVPVYLVNEFANQSLQGVRFRSLRTTQQNYCSVAIRAPCQGVVFENGVGGGESGNIAVPSGSRVDLFVDTNQYGAPAPINSSGTGLVLKGTNSALNAPDFPILVRGSAVIIDLTPTSSPVGQLTNSVGVTSILNDLNTSLIQSSNAFTPGTDPGTGIDSHLPTYLGNLGSNQPLFDYWPRQPMFDDSATVFQSFEDVDDDYDLMLT